MNTSSARRHQRKTFGQVYASFVHHRTQIQWALGIVVVTREGNQGPSFELYGVMLIVVWGLRLAY